MQSQAHKLARYVELEKENAQLKEDFTRLKLDSRNRSLLEEEVYDLKSRLSKHKELEKKLADLQVSKMVVFKICFFYLYCNCYCQSIPSFRENI